MTEPDPARSGVLRRPVNEEKKVDDTSRGYIFASLVILLIGIILSLLIERAGAKQISRAVGCIFIFQFCLTLALEHHHTGRMYGAGQIIWRKDYPKFFRLMILFELGLAVLSIFLFLYSIVCVTD